MPKKMRAAYQHHMPLLRFLGSDSKTKAQLRQLIPQLNNAQRGLIAEIVLNILKGVIPLSVSDKELLRLFVKQIRVIGQPKTTLRLIRKVLTSSGLLALAKVSLPYIDQLPENESHR